MQLWERKPDIQRTSLRYGCNVPPIWGHSPRNLRHHLRGQCSSWRCQSFFWLECCSCDNWNYDFVLLLKFVRWVSIREISALLDEIISNLIFSCFVVFHTVYVSAATRVFNNSTAGYFQWATVQGLDTLSRALTLFLALYVGLCLCVPLYVSLSLSLSLTKVRFQYFAKHSEICPL